MLGRFRRQRPKADTLPSADLLFSGRTKDAGASPLREPSSEISLDPLGLTVLYEPTASHVVNIIFVHGLGGTSCQSWSKDRKLELFWPKKWLPYEPGLSQARILTFGYNSRFASSSRDNLLNLSDLAKELLFNLKYSTPSANKQDDISAVPLIFVAHSLGGLVVKRALLLAQHDPSYSPIVKATSGIIFLSTPHRGSGLANELNRILSASFSNEPPKRYITELMSSSMSIQNINEQFRHLAATIDIVSCYDTLPTAIGPTNMLISHPDSSIMGIPSETSMALVADHYGISRYSSREDPNYIRVCAVLKSLVNKSQSTILARLYNTEAEELQALRDFLGHSEPTIDELDFFADKRSEGSGEWLFDDPALSSWLHSISTTPEVLWLTGKPGSGKSVLTSFLIEHLQKQKAVLAYHFCRFGDQAKNNERAFFLSTALQLATALPELRRKLLQMHNDGVKVRKMSLSSLWQKLIEQPLTEIAFGPPVFICIDALDEMEKPPSLLRLFYGLHDSRLALRILFSSRATGALRTSMQGLANYVIFRHIEIDANKHDIRRYIELAIRGRMDDPSFEEEVVGRIMENAHGNFLWVHHTVFEILRCYSKQQIEEVLHQTPPELEDIYQRIDISLAARNSKRNVALGRRILAWIAYCRYPLTLTELTEALEPDHGLLLDIRRTIQEVCGDFITIDAEQRLTLVHSSARNSLLTNESFNYYIPPLKTNQMLFSKCVDTLLMANLDAQTGTDYKGSFVYYAMTSWAFHLELADSFSDLESVDLLRRFFESQNLLHWVHHLGHASKLHILIQAADTLVSLLRSSDKLDEERNPLTHRLLGKDLLNRWAQDLIRIVGKFGVQLQQHPRSIYYLIPALSPEKSIIRTQFSSTTADSGLMLRGTIAPYWDDCLARFSISGDALPLEVLCLKRHFAVVTTDGTVRLFYSSTCDEARNFHHNEQIIATCFTPYGEQMATYGSQTTKIWKSKTSELVSVVANPPTVKILTMTFDGEGLHLITCSNDGLIRVCDFQALQSGWIALADPVGSQPGEPQQAGPPILAKFNKTGSLLAVACRESLPSVWEITDKGASLVGYCERRFDSMEGQSMLQPNMTDARDLCWNPVTGHLLGVYSDGCVFKWHPFHGSYKLSTIQAVSIQCSDDGSIFVTCSSNGSLRVWDFYHFSTIYQLSYTGDVTCMAIDRKIGRVYDIRDKVLNIWEPNALFNTSNYYDYSSDAGSARQSSTQISLFSEADVEVAEPVTALAIDPDRGYYVVGHDSGVICVYDEVGERLAGLPARTQTVNLACWSGNGSRIATMDVTRTVMVEELFSGTDHQQQVPSVTLLEYKEGESVRQICLDEEGERLLVATRVKTIVWSVSEMKPLASVSDPENCFWCQSPQDLNILLGFGIEVLVIASWNNPREARTLTVIDESEADSDQRDEQRWSSLAYSMDHDMPRPKVSRALVSGDGSLALTEITYYNAKSKRQKIFSLLDFDHLQTDAYETRILAFPIPLELEIVLEIPLGFIAHDHSDIEEKDRPSTHIPDIDSKSEACNTSCEQVLVFLSKDFWVCTFDFGMGPSAQVQRYYFLPRDWCNSDMLELATVTRQGDLVCPQNEQVVIFCNGLRRVWKD